VGSGVIIRKISRDLLEQKPYEAWNAFVNLVAMESYDDLDEVQRIAHLCFWYDSEVQNGGHLQYLENRGTILLDETLAALQVLGAECQYRVLKSAGHLFFTEPRDRPETVMEYVETALKGEFDSFDSAYHGCEPSIQKLLEYYLDQHKDHFIEVTDP
jgi:hypothetical protein